MSGQKEILSPFRLALILIILAVVIISGAWLRLASVRQTTVTYPLWGDSREYYAYAYNLRHKAAFSLEEKNPYVSPEPVKPDAIRWPGYPVFLMPFASGAPSDLALENIYRAQAVLSTLTVLAAFLFFLSFLPLLWAACAALLVAFSPHLLSLINYVLSETLFCFALVCMAMAAALFFNKSTRKRAVGLGVCMGLATLIRPSLIFFPCVAALFLFFNKKPPARARNTLALLAGFALILAPWILRNAAVCGGFSQDRLAVNFLHHGMYPDVMYANRPETFAAPYLFDPRSPEISKSLVSVTREIGSRFLREPGTYMEWYLLKKPLYLWAWKEIQGRDVFIYAVSKTPYDNSAVFRGLYRLMHALHGPLVFLCFLGCVLAWIPRLFPDSGGAAPRVAQFASLVVIYYILFHVAGFPLPRYSVPLRPFQYGMAMYALHVLAHHLIRARREKTSQKTCASF